MNTIENKELLLEQSILGTILLSDKDKQIEQVESLDINLFYNEYNKNIFKTMKELIKENLKVDIVLLAEKNKNIDILYLTQLGTHLTGLDKFEDYIYQLKKNAEYRNAKNIITSAITKIDLNNYEEILGDVVKNIEKFEDNSTNNTDTNESRMLEAFYEILDNIHNEIKYPNWGIKAIDNFSIGIKPSETTVVAGASGLGKTALVTQILLNAFKQDKKILFFNLEMNIKSLLKRIYSTIFGISVDEIEKCKDNTKLQNAIHDFTIGLIKSNRFIIRDDVKSIEEMRRIIRKENADIIAVDYLQLCESNREFYNREQEVAYISREFKEISKKFNCHIIQLSQVNADALDHRPRGEKGLRESKAIYHSVDNCIYLWEPTSQYFGEYENRTFIGKGAVETKLENYEDYEKWKKETGYKFVEIILEKQRNGRTGRGISLFEGANNKYKETYFTEKKTYTQNNNKPKVKPKL